MEGGNQINWIFQVNGCLGYTSFQKKLWKTVFGLSIFVPYFNIDQVLSRINPPSTVKKFNHRTVFFSLFKPEIPILRLGHSKHHHTYTTRIISYCSG